MTIEQLRKMQHAQPFQPFDIHLADGRSIPVNHPELLLIAGRTAGIAMPDETIEIIDLLLVTSLKPRANGRKRPRKNR